MGIGYSVEVVSDLDICGKFEYVMKKSLRWVSSHRDLQCSVGCEHCLQCRFQSLE